MDPIKMIQLHLCKHYFENKDKIMFWLKLTKLEVVIEEVKNQLTGSGRDGDAASIKSRVSSTISI